jgi:hypothetical protein
MGTVYKALHTKLDRVVAIKVLTLGRAQDQRAIARFEREMKAIGKLDHRHIVRAYDAREIDGTPTLVMEYTEGLDLGEIVRRVGWLDTDDACELARQAALGLQYVHEHGMVHRDVKPSNLMLTSQGEVKILDLGLARFRLDQPWDEEIAGTSRAVAGEMTTTDQAMGTADYMAPEQVSNSRHVDIRADIYGLGCTLYKLLSGRAPFSGPEHNGPREKMVAHTIESAPPIRQFRPDIPEGLADMLDRMLAKSPEARYSIPAEVAEALAPWCARADLVALLRQATGEEAPVPGEDRRSQPARAAQTARKPRPLLASWGRKWLVAMLGLLLIGGFGFALGIMIRIKRDGRETTVEVPVGSHARVTDDGDVEVDLPSRAKAEGGFLAEQLREATAGDFWAKYRLWAAYHKGTNGVQKNPEAAKKWLAEVVKGAYLATFRPAHGFAPKTPQEFLAKFNEHSSLRSEPKGLGGASFFRTRAKDGVLIGSFLTAYPDKMREAIAANPSLELLSVEELTPEMFVRYEASPQESLDTIQKRPSSGDGQSTKRSTGAERSNDTLLNESQRAYRDWTEEYFSAMFRVVFDGANWQLSPADKAAKEEQWIKQLSTLEGNDVIPAISGVAAFGTRRAVPALLKIASERREKDNRDRWMAIRALGLIGDQSVVPELIDLTYHYNQNVRFWAQISLVRITGHNFGRDAAAWKRWWNQQGGTPPASDETVTWATSPEMLVWADPQKQAETDRQFLEEMKARKTGGQVERGAVPQIVATSPPIGATEVDPATAEIAVTFDRDMGGGFSWTGGGPDHPPTPEGKSALWRDLRTCVLPVKLEAGHYYRVGINSTSFQNFQSAQGVPAHPSAVYFVTQGASEELKNRARKPQVVSTNPPNGAKDVDPALRELRVTFNMSMGGGFSWVGGGPHYPKTTDNAHWTEGRKTCVLPVELKPGWDYRLGLNSPSFKNFQSEAGIPLEPVEYTFRTRDQDVSTRPAGQAETALEHPPEDMKFTPAGSDEDAKRLVERVLEANKPWLEPKPVEATYWLSREAGATKERSGPFLIGKGCKPAVRVGSIVRTPLHNVARKDTRYTLRMVGKAEWKGKSLLAVDVAFDPPDRGAVGFGGQAGTTYSSCDYSTATARIMIEPTKAIPLFMECWSEVLPQSDRRYRCVWAFDPDFFEIDGGFAPKLFVWDDVSSFSERQEFQVVGGVWIFKQGDAWYGAENLSGMSGHIQKLELLDLQLVREKED